MTNDEVDQMSEDEVRSHLGEPISMGELIAIMNELGPQYQDGDSKSMPAEKAKSVLAGNARIFNKAIKKHAKDNTTYGLIRLPGGINNGIAQLQAIEWGTAQNGNNKGQPFCRIAGVVHEPKTLATVDGVQQLAGLQTSILIMLCDTKSSDGKATTAEDNMARLLNEIRRIGGEDFTESAESVEDLEELCKELVEQKPFFRFSTELSRPQIDPKTKKPKVNPTTGKPYEPRVFENWHGSKGLEEYSPASAHPEEGVAEEIEEQEEDTPKTSPKGDEKSPSKKPPVEVEDDEPEFQDMDSLAKKAQKGDAKAEAQLRAYATKAGVPEEDVDNAEKWAEVVDMIRNAGDEEAEEEAEEAEEEEEAKEEAEEEEETEESEEEEEESEEEEVEEEEAEEEEETPEPPTKGEVVMFKPIDPKTKKAAKTPTECEIVAVDKKAQTVTLKNLETKKQYLGVKWDKLLES